MTADKTLPRIEVGQVWEKRAGSSHAGLRVVVERVNGHTAKLHTLKNRHTNSMGGSSKNTDREWHLEFEPLASNYVLVQDVETLDDESEVSEMPKAQTRTEAYAANQRQSWKDRFDALTDAERREILEARQARMETDEIIRTWGIGRQVLGLVIAWGAEHYTDALILHDKPAPVVEQAADTYVPEKLEIDASQLWTDEPAPQQDVPDNIVSVFGVTTPITISQFKVKMLVYQPVEIERTFSASSYAQAEQQAKERIDNLHEIIGIEKVR